MSITTAAVANVQARRRRTRLVGLLIGAALLSALLLVSLAVGTRPLPLAVTWDAIVRHDPQVADHLLVLHLRVPRTLVGLVVGAALGVAGAVIQALTRNPLADTGILGVNAGAAAAVVIAIAVFGVRSPSGYMWFSLLGAAAAGTLVYLLGGLRRGTNPVRLVLAGAALSVVLGSLTQIVILNSDVLVLDNFRFWAVGSLQGRGYDVLLPVLGLVAVGLAIALLLARSLDAAALGNDLAKALGADPVVVWGLSAMAVVLLSGAATAAAGPVGFVGLVSPHLARLVTGPDHRWLLPYAMLIGALLVVGSDVIGRLVTQPNEVSVGILVALIGGPFFVALVRRRKLVQL